MKDLEKLNFNYMGYNKPETSDEVILEILGLELMIKTAEQRIALLKQSLKVAEIKAEDQIKQNA